MQEIAQKHVYREKLTLKKGFLLCGSSPLFYCYPVKNTSAVAALSPMGIALTALSFQTNHSKNSPI
jgi:hypothetical protein